MKKFTQQKRIKSGPTALCTPGCSGYFRQFRSTAVLAVLVLALLMAGFSESYGQTTFNATISSNQQFYKPNQGSVVCGDGTYGTFTSVSAGSTLFSYATQAFTVSTAGNVTITINSAFPDPMLYVYTGSFNPSSPLTNFKVGDDDSGPGTLSLISCSNYFNVGTYVIVVTAYNSGTTNGTANFTISSGGAITVLPTVSTSAATGIGSTSATLNGNVSADGGATVTAKGVAYSTSSNPTAGASSGSGTGAITTTATPLSPGTTYYARAWATNSVGTAYGAQVSFTTVSTVAPTVSTGSIASITQNSASCNSSNVTNSGGATVTGRGIYYGTSPSPSSSSVASGSGTGTFNASMSGLAASTRYYVRAYATNSAGTGYGSDQSFVTNHILTYTAGANGSISGTTSQSVANGGSGTAVTAVPNANYSFVNWSDGSTTNPRTETNVTTSKSLTANFTLNRLVFYTQPSTTIAGNNIPFTIRITDSYGNLMTNSDGNTITVAIGTNAGGGTIAGTLTLTPSGGVASSSNVWINKTGNGYTLTATASPLTGATSSSFNITPAAIDHFHVTGITDPVVAGTTTTPIVTALDQYENVKTNYTGTIQFTANTPHHAGEVLPSYTFLSGDYGVKSLTNGVTLKTTGERTVTVTGTVDGKTGSQTAITVTPAPIHSFTLVANNGDPVTAGTAFSVTATVWDEFDNIKTNYEGPNSVTWTTTATSSQNGTARIIPANGNQTFTAGVATIGGFTFFNSDQSQLTPFVSPTITITDGPTSSPGTTAAIEVLNAPLDNFKVVAGTTQQSGIAFSTTVTARDIYWNTCVDYTGSIRFKSSDDALVTFPSGLQAYTLQDAGVRTFTNGLLINTIGAYWVRAADATYAYKSGDQQNIVVGPGPFSPLVARSTLTIAPYTGTPPSGTVGSIADPVSRVAGEYVFVTATPRDAQGNLLYSCRDIKILINGSTSDYDGIITVTNVGDGSYTAIVRATLLGANTISARYDNPNPDEAFAQTRTVNVTAAPVDLTKTLITASPSGMTTDEHSHITVQLRDLFENNRSTSDGIITLETTHGVLSAVVDNTDGTYSSILTGNYGSVYIYNIAGYTGIAHITGALAGTISGTITDTEDVTITEGLPAVSTIQITADPSVITTNETSTISVQLEDQWGNLVTTNRGTVALSSTLGSLSAVTYTSAGIYQSTLSGFLPGFGPTTITGTYNGDAIVDDAVVTFNEGLPDLAHIEITADPATMTSDESSTITIQLKDIFGNSITTNRGAVVLSSTRGSISAATYATSGRYTATLTGDNRGFGAALITGVFTGSGDASGVNGSITDNATVTITEGKPDLTDITVTPASGTMTTDETRLITVQLKDQWGNNLSTSRGIVTLATSLSGTALTAVTDNSNGSYSATLSTIITGTTTISGYLSDVPDGVSGDVTDDATVVITEGKPALAQIQITVSDDNITTDETSLITVQLRDQWGNNLSTQRGTVALASSDHGSIGTVYYAGSGTYTATLSGDYRGAGSPYGVGVTTITGILTDVPDAVTGNITDNATVTFTEGLPTLALSDLDLFETTITTDGHCDITMYLKDQWGNYVTHYRGAVTFASTIGAMSATTGGTNGIYSAILTGDTRGTNGTGTSIISASFVGEGTASGVNGAFAETGSLSITEGLPALATTVTTANPTTMTTDETSTITVQLKDWLGNLITHDRSTVTLATTLGVLTGGVTAGADDGVYTATLYGNSSGTGTATLTATLSGVVAGTVADGATVTITDGAPNLTVSTVATNDNSITTDESCTITVQLKDQFGNNISTSRGTVVIATTLGAISAVTDNGDGTYSAILSGNSSGVGTATVSATLGGSGLTSTVNVSITEGLPNLVQSTITASVNSITTDQTSLITVRLKDQWGNLITHTRGTVALSTTLGVLTSVTDNNNGTYQATLSANASGTGTALISGGLTGGVTGSFTDTESVTITEGLPVLSRIQITSVPTSITADQTSTITVQLQDQWGNNLTTSRGSVSLTNDPIGHLGSVTDNGDGTYSAIFSLTAYGTGLATITGNFTGTGDAEGVSGPITDNATVLVSHGVATHLTILTQPSTSATAGVVFAQQPVVRIEDQFDNLVTSDDATVVTAARSTGTATLQGTLTATAIDGVATFSTLFYTKAETINLAFTSSPVLTATTSTSIVVGHAPIDHFVLNSPADFMAGATRAAYTVTRYDVYDNLVNTGAQTVYLYSSSTGANKKFYTALSGGSIITSLSIADAASTANFWYYDEKTGNHTITVSDATPAADGDVLINDASDDITVTPSLLKDFIVYGVPDPHDLGTWQSVTVEPRDTYNNRKTNYVGSVTFSNTDVSAINPPDYHYTIGSGGDNGIHTFTNLVKFSQTGLDWWLTAIDLAEPTKYGAQTGITVQRAVTIASTDQTKIYKEVKNLGTTGFTISAIVPGYGEVAGEITGVTLTSTGTPANAHVGSYPIVPSAVVSGTYNPLLYRIVYASTGNLTVSPATLTLSSFLADNKVYDRTTDVTGPSGSRFSDDRLSGDELTFSYTAAFSDYNVADGKTVNYTDISISGGSDELNYTLASTIGSTTANITPKTVTPSIVADSKCFDNSTTATLSSQSVSGVISPDVVTLGVTAANFATSTVGTGITVTATGLTLGGADATNYSLNGVTSTTTSADIYVLPIPSISGSATVCINTSASYTTEAGKTDYIWSVPSGGSITSGQGTTTATVSWTTAGNHSVTVNYTDAHGCDAATATTYNVVVNPAGQVNHVEDLLVCNGAATSVTFSTTNGGGTTTYAWTNDNTSINLGASGSSNITSFNAANSGVEPLVAGLTVTPTYTFNSVGCVGTPETFTITVNPTATVSSSATASRCNNTSTTYTATSASSLAQFAWTRALVTNISNAAVTNGTGADITETLVNTSTEPVVVHYLITPSVNGCEGTIKDVAVTVNPTSIVNSATTANWCNAISNTYTATSTSSTAQFTWTRAAVVGISNAEVTNGSGATITETLVNTTTEPKSVVYLITPSVNGCAGVTFTFTATVNPTSVISSANSANWCNAVSNTYSATSTSSTATFAWTRAVVAGISNDAVTDGTGATITETLNNTTTEPKSVIYLITPSVNGCAGETFSFTATVNPTSVISSLNNANWCNAVSNTYVATSTSSTATFAWTRAAVAGITNTAVTDGIGATITETLVNTSTEPIVVHYLITPGVNGCAGTTEDVSVTVNPTAIVNSAATASRCDNVETTYTATSSTVATATYAWTRAAVDGISNIAVTNGTGAAITETLDNTTPDPVVVHYLITPSVNGCAGTTKDVAVTVNPTSVVSSAASGIWCNNSEYTYTILSSSTTPTPTYQWSRAEVSGITPASNSGITDYITETLVNSTNNPVDVIYLITPTVNSCAGTQKTVTITVNPTPIMTDPSDQTRCAGAATAAVNFISTNTTGGTVTYEWSNNNTSIGLAASGTGNISSFTPTNLTALDKVATITVTPYYSNTNGGSACAGPSQTFTITVKAAVVPIITGSNEVCLNSTGVIYNTEAGMSGYNWTITGGTITDDFGRRVFVTWNTAGTQTLTVSYTNTDGCTSVNPTVYNVIVNPLPTPTVTSGPTEVCVGTTGTIYTTQEGMTDYLWQVSSGGANTAFGTSLDDDIVITWHTAGVQTVKINYTDTHGCTAEDWYTYNVTVNPLTGPTVFSAGATTVCQDAANETYIAAAANQTSIVYTVTPSSAGTISGGVMDWDPSFSGTATITATATGLCGTTSADRVVTVNPSTGETAFTTGATTVCQNAVDETYTATAAHSTSVAYSVLPVEAGVIGASTGIMNWDAAFSGTATITATATGLCTTTHTDLTITVNPSTGTTAFTGGATTVCQDAANETYSASAANSTSIVFTVAPESAGVFTGGVMNWDAAFSGTATITATATGLCGTTSAERTVTVNPSTGITAFTSGATIVCQNADDETYAATADHSTSVAYSVLPVEAGTIGITSGIMNWDAAFSGTATITATATGLCTSTSAERTVTVNPSTGLTAFTTGATTVCQNATDETYTATAAHSTSVAYSVLPVEAGVIGSGTGIMNWDAAFSGIATITATSTGLCGITSAERTVIVNPSTGTTAFTGGATTVCQDAANETYTASAANSTSIVFTVAPESAGVFTGGVLDWDAAFSGTATITATATGLCGTTSVELIVTVNPSTGVTAFTAGATTVCQNAGDETYSATAAHSTSVSYSVLPVEAGTIESGTGVMNWDAAFSGTATITATATGLCTTTSAERTVIVNPSTGTTAFIGGAETVCQDAANETYTASAANSTSIVFTVAPESAGIFTGGIMDWDAAFSGTATITATATGLCGTTSAELTVTVNPSTGTTAFTGGATTVCQNAIDETYTASSANSTSIVFTVAPESAGVFTGGVMNWDAAFSGTATITATATGLCGTTSAERTVTVNPSTGLTAFTSGATTVCQNADDETYAATADNSISIAYSVLPVEAGTINEVSGIMNWDAAFSGTATITATSTGLCGSTSAERTVTVNPSTGETAFLLGANTVCQNSADETYTASAAHSTSISYSVLPAEAGSIGSTSGIMNWDAAFSGTATITATATGLCGTTSAEFTVTVNPSTGITAFTGGATTVCQDAVDETYTASAENSTSIVFTVAPESAGVFTGGVMNWDAAFSGTATITATATGLCGTTSAELIVTVNPSTGTTAFTAGAQTVCQNSADETYTATAAHSTSVSYSVLPVEAGTIESGTGVMNWDAAFSGTATITATANGLCGTTSASRTVTVNPLPAAVAGADRTICYNDATTLGTTAVSGSTYSWSSNPAGFSSTVANPTFTPLATTTFTVIETVTLTGCSNTNSVVVTVRPEFIASVASSSQTLCYSTAPTTLSATAASGASNSFTYKWQSSTNNSTWNDISGQTSLTYSPGTLLSTMYYRILATDVNCGSKESNVITITVYNPLTKPVISSAQTICPGTAPAQLTATPATGGSGAFSYQWQQKASSSSIWVNVGTNSLTYQPGTLSVPTDIQVIALNTGTTCGSIFSNSITIGITPAVGVPSTPVTAENIRCQGVGTTEYTTSAANATSYTWSVTGTGNTISGTGTTGTVTWAAGFSGTADITVTATNLCGTSGSSTAANMVVTPTVGTPSFTLGSTVICQGSAPEQYTATATNSLSITYSVLPVGAGSITTGGMMTWNAGFSGIATITASASGCGIATADREVTVHPTLVPVSVSGAQSICYGTSAAVLSRNSASGGSGAYSYMWQSSPDNSTWTNTGQTGTSFSPGVLNTTTYYKVVVTDAVCGTANSNTVTVTVFSPFTEPSVSSAQTICYNTAPSQLSTTPATGGSGSFSYQWQQTTTPSVPDSWINVGVDALTFQPDALTATTTFRVIANDIGTLSCGAAYGNSVTITVNDVTTPGTIACVDNLISSGTAPALITSTAAATGSGILSYSWESSTNGGANWSVISGAISETYQPGIQNLSTRYRRIASASANSIVCTATSDPVIINVTIRTDLHVNLEGPYSGSAMTNGNIANIPLDQPYNAAPWNYAGAESVASIPTGVVDWVLIELRQATAPEFATTIMATRAAFLKTDGSIVDLDGTSTVHFDDNYVTTGNNLYTVIRQRNHLAVMSATGALFSGGVYSYDFTTGIGQAYGGNNGYKAVGSTYGMVSGDADSDGDISTLDFTQWSSNFGITNTYSNPDLDLDGEISTLDFTKWSTNFGMNTPAKGSTPQGKYKCQVPDAK